ncbi:MAG: hypothetical protein AB7G35_04480 [Hyphomicrobiaceae bacterium]
MMRLLIVVLVLAGCAAGPTDVTAGCPRDVPFWQSWPCERHNTKASSNPTEFKEFYVSIGNVVAEKSAAGLITDAEADMIMAKAVLEVNDGIRASRPNTVVVPMPVQNRQITCQRHGQTVNCY